MFFGGIMNTPNKLSLARVLLVIPVVILLYMTPAWCRYAALIAFIAASLTDLFDGKIARKYNLVTNFGKFIDPLADKLLVLSTMIALAGLGELPSWLCILVLFRELAIDGLRLVAAQQGQVIAAGPLGKLKTTLQMAMLVYVLAALNRFVPTDQTVLLTVMDVIKWILIALSALLTLVSGIDYFIRNRQVFADGMK